MRRLSHLYFLRVLTLGLFITSVVEAAPESEQGTLSVVFENDLFYGTDRNYTNGIRAAWLSGPKEPANWVSRVAGHFPLFPDGANLRLSYAVGQSMYVPTDISVANPARGERPYAGWLYGSVGAIAESDDQLDQLQLTVGIIGPASLARQTQEFVHDITGSDAPKGWDTQLKNELGVVLTYQRSWRQFESGSVLGFSFDLTPHAGAALGNVFTYANTGMTLRLGHRLTDDYGPPRIQPSLPGSGFFVPQDGVSWYLFAGVEGRAVARNIFLDGNSFRDSRSVDKHPLVADFQFGLAINFDDIRLSYTHVLRSPEFEGQNLRDNFGALSLSVRF